MEPIPVGNFEYTQDDKGGWTFKAKEGDVLKKDGTLKVEYKELPQFDLIYGIEAHMQGQMDNEIKQAVKEITKELK
jgi:hypothetical protein